MHSHDHDRCPTGPLLVVETMTMRFGGLVAVNDLSFDVARGDITALIGPNGAGKTTVFNCITGFYKPTDGRMALSTAPTCRPTSTLATASGRRTCASRGGTIFLLERMPDYEIAAKAKVARTFQNIRLFSGMTVLENLIVAQHNALMHASGCTSAGCSAQRYRDAEARGGRARQVLARQDRPHRPRRRSGRRPALRRPAPAGDRPRDVHRPGAALPRRAGRRPQPARERSSSTRCCARSATSTRHVDPADRARHVRGDGDLRPRRRARLRHQDLRRHARSR